MRYLWRARESLNRPWGVSSSSTELTYSSLSALRTTLSMLGSLESSSTFYGSSCSPRELRLFSKNSKPQW